MDASLTVAAKTFHSTDYECQTIYHPTPTQIERIQYPGEPGRVLLSSHFIPNRLAFDDINDLIGAPEKHGYRFEYYDLNFLRDLGVKFTQEDKDVPKVLTMDVRLKKEYMGVS